MEDRAIQAALERHWAASAAGDLETEHEIYRDDVVVEYPQSGERICGRHNIQALRGHHPSKLGFTIRRVIGSGDLWVSEYVITYDGRPVYTVSIMEFRDGKVAREAQYFADPFDPPAWRTQWVEQME
jgi:ketosteroid isomerase-like protein